MRSLRSRPVDLGDARARHLAVRHGAEMQLARTMVGLTQLQLARRAGVSQAQVSRAERGDVSVSLVVRCRLAAGCGSEIGWKLYPLATIGLRDSGQLEIAEAIVCVAHASWRPALEQPVAPGDRRAADVLFSHPLELAQVEVERWLVDFQAQLRSAQLKRAAITEHDSRPVRLVIAVPDTTSVRNRLVPHREIVERALPVSSRRIWAALRSGQPIGGDGLLFVRPRQVVGAARQLGPATTS